MNKIASINIVLVLATTIVLSTMLTPLAHAVSGTAVEVLPSLLNKDDATPGSAVTFEVAVSKVSGMAGFGLVVRYRSDVLVAASINPGPVFADVIATGRGNIFSDIQNDQGLFQVAFGIIDPLLSFSSMGRETLISIDFQVKSVGSSPILLESVILALLDGTAMSNVSVFSGYFNNDPTAPGKPQIADLSQRGAWPEAHKFRIGQQADPENTFFAHVTNNASVTQVVRIIFTVIGEAFGPATFESGFLVLAPGEEGVAQTQPTLGFNAAAAGPGKYFVSAQAFSSPDGNNFLPGIQQKSFSFQVST